MKSKMVEIREDDLRTLMDNLRGAHSIISAYRFPPSHSDIDIQVVDYWLKCNDWVIMKGEDNGRETTPR